MRITDYVDDLLIQKEKEISYIISRIHLVRNRLYKLGPDGLRPEEKNKFPRCKQWGIRDGGYEREETPQGSGYLPKTNKLEELMRSTIRICNDSLLFLEGLLHGYTDYQARINAKVALSKIARRQMGRKNDSATITKLHISFKNGAGYYNIIDMNGCVLSFKNRIPLRLSPYISHAESNWEAKSVTLSDNQMEELMEQINSIDYEKWESGDNLGVPELRMDGHEYQSFHCDYSDDSFFEYETNSTPPSSFREMFEILTRYCDWSLIPLSFKESFFR